MSLKGQLHETLVLITLLELIGTKACGDIGLSGTGANHIDGLGSRHVETVGGLITAACVVEHGFCQVEINLGETENHPVVIERVGTCG